MILTVTLNTAVDRRYVVENFESGKVNRVLSCVPSAGGKGINVARVAAIAGESVTATGFVGGYAGGFIKQQLAGFGIVNAFVETGIETRSCINLYDKATGRQTELLEPGPSVNKEQIEAFFQTYCRLAESAQVIAISGSVPKGVESALYGRMIRKAKELGKTVFLDTSGQLLCDNVLEKPSLIKPNKDEIATLLGTTICNTEDLIHTAKQLHESGIETVVVSLGKEGALVACKEGIFKGTTPDIPVVNTVGCGDSMIAAFAVATVRGLPTEEKIRFAMAVSTANALREETGFYLKEDLDQLLPLIKVISL